jgi:hypothetical protein
MSKPPFDQPLADEPSFDEPSFGQASFDRGVELRRVGERAALLIADSGVMV